MKRGVILFVTLAASAICVGATSDYTGQQHRSIKSLSQEEVADLLSGKGMGYAKAAELNGFPGPRHVLELADQLALTAQQRDQSQALFEEMRDRAVALGQELVEAEAQLDGLFAAGRATREAVDAATAKIGAIEARLRAAHLQAHLQQTALLTREQVHAYSQLRGYGSKGQPQQHDGRHH